MMNKYRLTIIVDVESEESDATAVHLDAMADITTCGLAEGSQYGVAHIKHYSSQIEKEL